MPRVANQDADARSRSLVKSATRVVELFEFLDDQQSPVTVTKVSRALNYPQSSASALLKSLTSLGYLQYDRTSRSFSPTDRVALMGSSVCPSIFGGSRIQKLVHTIVEGTGFDVSVGARHRDHVQHVYVSHGSVAMPLRLKAGLEHRLVPSAIGLALLAQSDNADIRRSFHRINAYRNLDEVVKVGELLGEVERVRQVGYAHVTDGLTHGVGAIAVNICSELSSRSLALVVVGPSGSIGERVTEIATLMKQEVSLRFGSSVSASNGEWDKNREISRIVELAN